jgi:hypothetical protein
LAREDIAMIVDKVRALVGWWAGGERERSATPEVAVIARPMAVLAFASGD